MSSMMKESAGDLGTGGEKDCEIYIRAAALKVGIWKSINGRLKGIRNLQRNLLESIGVQDRGGRVGAVYISVTVSEDGIRW